MSSAIGEGQEPSLRRAWRKPVIAEGANPTLRQRELGIRLRDYRIACGLTVKDVAERLEMLGDEDQPPGNRIPPGHSA